MTVSRVDGAGVDPGGRGGLPPPEPAGLLPSHGGPAGRPREPAAGRPVRVPEERRRHLPKRHEAGGVCLSCVCVCGSFSANIDRADRPTCVLVCECCLFFVGIYRANGLTCACWCAFFTAVALFGLATACMQRQSCGHVERSIGRIPGGIGEVECSLRLVESPVCRNARAPAAQAQHAQC